MGKGRSRIRLLSQIVHLGLGCIDICPHVAVAVELGQPDDHAFSPLSLYHVHARTGLSSKPGQANLPGPCQFPTLGFVVDQFNRVQSFQPETFWYISLALEREDEDDPDAAPRLVEFKWRRNHLFDEAVVRMLFEQVELAGEGRVERVETKPTTKW